MRERLDEVSPPELGRIAARLAGRLLDQTLDDEGRLRPAGAAIGVDRRGVGVDRVDLAVDGRDVVLAGQQDAIEVGRHRRRERREIRAEVGDRMDAQAGDLALGVERELGVRHVIAAVRVRQERFRSLRRPFDRPVDLLGRPGAHRLLGIDEDLRAEAAADVRSDHAQLVLRRKSDERRKDEPRDMRVLACRVERDRIGSGVVFADRGARLHRIRDQPVVDKVELGHVRSPGKGRIGGGLIAHVPIEHGVVWRRVVDLRLTGIGGGRGVDGGRQLAIVDNYLLRRFARLCISIGDHDGDMVADVARLCPERARDERRPSSAIRPSNGSSSRR